MHGFAALLMLHHACKVSPQNFAFVVADLFIT
jgi:hypothetical protein